MPVRFTHEAIDSDEFDRQQAIYEPFTAAVRDLLDATIRTEVDDPEVIADAQRAIEAVTARLRTKQIDGSYGVRIAPDGRSRPWGNPVVGLRNAIAPPLKVHRHDHGRY